MAYQDLNGLSGILNNKIDILSGSVSAGGNFVPITGSPGNFVLFNTGSSPSDPLLNAGSIRIANNGAIIYDDSTTGAYLYVESRGNTVNHFPEVTLIRGGGGIFGATPPLSGDQLGLIRFFGYTGDGKRNISPSSMVRVIASENFNSTNTPSEIQFWNTTTGMVSGQMAFKVDKENHIVLQPQSEPQIRNEPNALDFFNQAIANKSIAFFKGDYDINSAAVGTALWGKQISVLLPGNTTQTAIGTQTATTIGTISHIADEYYGFMTNFVSAAGLNSAAGTSFGLQSIYRGSDYGYGNGFFLASRFALVDDPATYATTGTVTNPSGLRFFFGATSNTLAIMLAQTAHPNSSYCGFHFCRATGLVTRVDTNFQFQFALNGSAVGRINTNMLFTSGLYQAYIFLPPYPNDNTIYWQLEKLNPDFTKTIVSGVTTGTNTLPTRGSVMRPAIGVYNMTTAAKNIRTSHVYCEV